MRNFFRNSSFILTSFINICFEEKKRWFNSIFIRSCSTIVSLLISIFIKVDIKPKKEIKDIDDNIYGEEEVNKKEEEDEIGLELNINQYK